MRLQILRHAPALDDGCLAGRRDVDADCRDQAAFARLARHLGVSVPCLTSPARRCRQTAHALGYADPPCDNRLWEQDFGDWEGRPYAELPDLGRKSAPQLASHRPPGGESFDDMAARLASLFNDLQGDRLIIAHAGTVRAALSQVVGPAALSFAVAPLSLSTLLRLGPGEWSVEAVNVTCWR